MRQVIVGLFICLNVLSVSAEDYRIGFGKEPHDSVYYDKLDNFLTLKLFSAQKFSDFEFNDNLLNQSMQYYAVSRYMMGVGASYKWLSLKLGFGMKNPDDSITVDPGKIDFQAQINLRRLTVNFYVGNNRGYYLPNPYNILKDWPEDVNYIRGDIKNKTYGMSGYYVLNSNKYSNRATFLQNEWQKKTAGSWLAGGSILYNSFEADSSFIPTNIIDGTFLHGTAFNKTEYYALGGNVGYTFTLVLWEHWFLNYSILGGVSYGAASIHPIHEADQKEYKLGLTLSNYMGFGFNSNRFYAGVNYTNLRAYSPLPIDDSMFGVNVGKMQILLAYRIPIKKDKNILPHWFPIKL